MQLEYPTLSCHTSGEACLNVENPRSGCLCLESRIPNLSNAGVPSLDCRSSTRKLIQNRKSVERTAWVQKRRIDSASRRETLRSSAFWPENFARNRVEDCGLSRSPHSLTSLTSLLRRSLRSLVRSARVHNLQVSIARSKIRAKRPMIVASSLSPVDSSFLAEAVRSTPFYFESTSLWTIHSREGTPA